MKKIIATVASLLMCGAAHAQTSQTFGAFMAGLPSASSPLSDSDVLYVLQGSTSAKVARSSLYNPFSFLHTGSGTAPGSPPFFAFDSESYNAGSGNFYEPFLFQENLTCAGASCGQRNTFVIQLDTINAQATQFYNTFEPENFALSGAGNFSASNPYMLVCNASGTGPCAAAAGVSATAEAVGEEIDTDVRIPSIVRKVALQLVSVATDQGVASITKLDGALLIANQTGGIGFRNGIIFGQDSADFGVYGSFLYAPSGPAAPTNYINFPNMTVTGAGAMTLANDLFAGNLVAGANNNHQWAGRSLMWSPADGKIALTNNNNDTFTLLQFGGITSSFPALKRSSATLQTRLADDSDYAALSTGALTATNVTLTSSTLPANGFYLSAANTVSLATNSTSLLSFSATGAIMSRAAGVDAVLEHVVLNTSAGYTNLELDASNGVSTKGWVWSKRTDDTLQLYPCTGCLNSGYGTVVLTFTAGGGLQMGAPTGGDKGAGTINAAGAYYANGSAGVTKTCTVNQALTLIFTNGILTGGSCNS